MKFLLKPANTKVNLDPNSTTVDQIFNSRTHTASLTKNGQPIGHDEKLLKDCNLAEHDFLWKVDKPALIFSNFKKYFLEDLKQISKKLKVEEQPLTPDQDPESGPDNGSSKHLTVELSLHYYDIKLPTGQGTLTGTVTISNNRAETLNIIIELSDSLTEAHQKPLNFKSLNETIYFLQTSLSQYLDNPQGGLLGLPNEVILKILKKLDGPSLAKFGATCKRLRKLAENEELWKKLVLRDYPLEALGEAQSSWKAIFISKYKERKAQERILEEERRRREVESNHVSPRPNPLQDPYYGGNNPYNRQPIITPRGEFPGMIGGVADLDPFAQNPYANNNPMRIPSNSFRPRGDPIFGPGSNHQPGPGRGIGSDDDVYVEPFGGFQGPPGRGGPGRGGPGRGGNWFPGGGFM